MRVARGRGRSRAAPGERPCVPCGGASPRTRGGQRGGEMEGEGVGLTFLMIITRKGSLIPRVFWGSAGQVMKLVDTLVPMISRTDDWMSWSVMRLMCPLRTGGSGDCRTVRMRGGRGGGLHSESRARGKGAEGRQVRCFTAGHIAGGAAARLGACRAPRGWACVRRVGGRVGPGTHPFCPRFGEAWTCGEGGAARETFSKMPGAVLAIALPPWHQASGWHGGRHSDNCLLGPTGDLFLTAGQGWQIRSRNGGLGSPSSHGVGSGGGGCRKLTRCCTGWTGSPTERYS